MTKHRRRTCDDRWLTAPGEENLLGPGGPGTARRVHLLYTPTTLLPSSRTGPLNNAILREPPSTGTIRGRHESSAVYAGSAVARR